MKVCTAIMSLTPGYQVRRVYKHGRIYIYIYNKHGLLIASILVYKKGVSNVPTQEEKGGNAPG